MHFFSFFSVYSVPLGCAPVQRTRPYVRHQGLFEPPVEPPVAARMAPAVDVPLMDVPVLHSTSALPSDAFIDPPVAVSMASAVAFDVRHQDLLDPPEAARMAPAVAIPLMDVPVMHCISAVPSDA